MKLCENSSFVSLSVYKPERRIHKAPGRMPHETVGEYHDRVGTFAPVVKRIPDSGTTLEREVR